MFNLYIRYVFTFHYGPIQIAVVENFKDNVKAFTFHYGPIQINFTCYTISLFSGIYIPLWSYSNDISDVVEYKEP